MATENDTGNLEVQKQINEVISARNALLVKQSELIRGQVLLAIELNKSLKSENAEEIVKNVNEITKGLKAASGAAETATKSMEGAAAAAKTAADSVGGIAVAAGDAATKLKRVGKAAKTAEEAAKSLGEALGDAFSKTGAQMDSLFSMIGSITTGIFGIGSAILSIPLKVFGILTEKAAELSNSSQALREAYENVRETFGDLNKAEAKGVINSFNQLQSSGGGLAGTGLSLARIYGHGPEGLAAALNELNETAAGMGPVFGVLQGQFEQNADKILVMQKGMGLGTEEMKALGQVAIATGGDLTQMMQEMGNLALQMGEKFGISSKLLGKDLGYMTTNMGKFGSMTKTQMITSAVYVRKLGLEIKDIEGLMGAFDNFEDAAQNAAKLAQGFGMTIDAMKMMKEQDPAKRLDMLRQAFAATGKSIETMSRQEKAMLASSAGLDENMVSLALSSKNMGKSYDDIQREADKSNKKQLSQAEVMDKLSDNIKRMTEALQTSGSFMTQFFNGLTKGFSRTPEFQRLMRNLAKALEMTMHFGMEVGKMIMDVFPGMKEMFGGLADFFEPGRFSGFLDELRLAFKSFFEDLQTDPINAVGSFMKKMKEKFTNFFDKESPEGKKFLGGVDKFGKAVGGIVAGFGKYLIEAAVGAITGLIDFIKNPSVPAGAPVGFVENFFAPILQVLKDQGPVLLSSLFDLLKTVLIELGPKIAMLGTTLFAFNIATMLIKGVVAGAAQAAGASLMQKALSKFGMDVAEKAAPDTKAIEKAGPSKGLVQSLKETIGELKDMKATDIMKAGMNLAVVVASLIPSVILFAIAIVAAAAIMSVAKMEDIIKVFISVAAGLLAVYAVSQASKLIKAEQMPKSALGILAAAAFVSLAILPFAAAIAAGAFILQGTSWEEIGKVFASVAIGILATVGLVLIGAALGNPSTLAAMGLAIQGLLAAAGVMMIGLLAYTAAIRLAVLMLDGVAFSRVTEIFGMLGMAMLATITMVGIAYLMTAAFAGGVGAIAAVAGLVGAAVFLTLGVFVFAEALNAIINGFPDTLKAGDVDKVLGTINSAILSSFGLLAAGAVVAALAFFAGGALVAAAVGIYALAKFFSAVIPAFVPAIQAIADMPLMNPDEAKQKVEIFNSVIGAMSGLAKMGVDAAKVAALGTLFGGGNIADIFNKMSEFIITVKDAVMEVTTSLIGMAMKWNKSQLEKAKTLAEVVGAIGELAAGLSGPISALASADTGVFQESTAKRLESMQEGMSSILASFLTFIPGIIRKLVTMDIGKTKIDKAKVSAITEIAKALGPIFSGVGSIVKEFVGVESDIIGPSAVDKIKAMGEGIGSIFAEVSAQLPGLIGSIIESVKKTEGMKELPEMIKGIFGGIKNMIAAIKDLESLDYGGSKGVFGQMGDAVYSFFAGEGPTVNSMFTKLADDVTAMDSQLSRIAGVSMENMTKSVENMAAFRRLGLAGTVAAITEDIKAVNDALGDLGDIDISATVDHLGEALQLKTEVLNIERKPIQMNVNLHLTMKAEDIAKEILQVSQKATLKSNSKLYNVVQDFLGRS